MESKLFEIRDAATFIPVLAVRLNPNREEERYLLGRTGYGITVEQQGKYVVVFKLAGGVNLASCDTNEWGESPRTVPVAHRYIIEHWAELMSGDVIDVEFILGETSSPKESERVGEGL